MRETCYSFVVCVPPIAQNDKTAWEELDRIVAEPGEPPEIFRRLYGRLIARYPSHCVVTEDEFDDWVWGDAPLWDHFGHRAAVIEVTWSRINEVLPFLIEASNGLGLTVFDGVEEKIHRPGKGVPVDWLRRWMT